MILSGNPKDEPLRYGVVFSIWTNISKNNGIISGYQHLWIMWVMGP